MSLLNTINLNISIADKQICKALNISFEAGQIWGLLGRNGIGKTTLLHTLCHLRADYSGQIKLNNQNIEQLKRKTIAQKIGIQLQHTEDPFPSSVFDTVLTGRHPYISNWQWEDEDDRNKANAALAIVEMSELADRAVNNLSGGERQRVSLATLITQDPEIFLLDEPNSHLDLNYQIKLLQYLTDYAKSNNHLLIMSLHDINLAARFCSHLLMLTGDGQSIAGRTGEVLNQQNLTHTFKHPIHEITDGDKKYYLPS
ncbi:MAG: ABC transporter ATP-binding protein [Gammaproteobacteria bacterium]|nr:ABC transporter ATP-binding protein [Gammaproteobacteria bacterium]